VKTYKITLRVETEHTYEIEANTSEEAESVAEDLYIGEDLGEASINYVEVSDSYAITE